jgi:NADH dehydrogenase
MIRVVIVHSGGFILPELGEELGRYAERKLRERGVEVFTGVRVAGYDATEVKFDDGRSVPAGTLIWTAGVKPSAVIESLPYEREKGRVRVNEFLSVPQSNGLWAVVIAQQYLTHTPASRTRQRLSMALEKAWPQPRTSNVRF